MFSIILSLLLCVALPICHGLCPSPTITQTTRGSWNDGGNSYSIWDNQIVNHGDETLLYVRLEIEGNLLQFWEIVEVSSSENTYTLPEWRKTNGIQVSGSHSIGFISNGLNPVNISVLSFFCTSPAAEAELFQVSTISALSLGLFEGTYPVGLLKKKGDFGVGTYDSLDGEMIVLNGHFYHVYSNGLVEEADDSQLVPFAAVVFFQPQIYFNITSSMTMAQLNNFTASVIPTDNFFYAIKIHGHFSSVTNRAAPRMNRPYPNLSEATNFQVIMQKENIFGTAVVLRCPRYAASFNAVGNHYHFISDDHLAGGHALDLTITEGTLEIQQIRQFKTWIPDTDDFKEANLV